MRINDLFLCKCVVCYFSFWQDLDYKFLLSKTMIRALLFSILYLLPLTVGAQALDDDLAGDGALFGPPREEEIMFEDARRGFLAEYSALRAGYRKSVAKALQEADQIEVLLLSFTHEKKDIPDDVLLGGEEALEAHLKDWFHIAPYDSYSKILQRRMLTNQQKEQCLKHVSELLGEANDHGGGAFCHFPIHGIRLYKNGDKVFETSLCWKCSNYFLRYPDKGRASWVGFSVDGLEKWLKEVMPITQSEIDRFNKAYPPDRGQ